MRFLIDARLPPALARWLIAAGHEAEHVAVSACGPRPMRRSGILALQEGAAIITKDEDFVQRHALAGTGPAVIWIRLRNTRRADLLAWFEVALPRVLVALARGETLIGVV